MQMQFSATSAGDASLSGGTPSPQRGLMAGVAGPNGDTGHRGVAAEPAHPPSQPPEGYVALRPSVALAAQRHYDRARQYHNHQQQPHSPPQGAAMDDAARAHRVPAAASSTDVSPDRPLHMHDGLDDDITGINSSNATGAASPDPAPAPAPSRLGRVAPQVVEGGTPLRQRRRAAGVAASADPAVAHQAPPPWAGMAFGGADFGGGGGGVYQQHERSSVSPARPLFMAPAHDVRPAMEHWAALDLPPSSTVARQDEPLHTLLHGGRRGGWWAWLRNDIGADDDAAASDDGRAASAPGEDGGDSRPLSGGSASPLESHHHHHHQQHHHPHRSVGAEVCHRCKVAGGQLGRKLAGKRESAPPMFSADKFRTGWRQLLGTFVLTFTAMLLVSALHYHVFLEQYKLQFFVAPFGATAAIVFSLTDSDSAQPRNVFLGHMICAAVGVSARHIFAQHGTDAFMVAGPLALSICVTLMQATNVMHPPGCATALLAVYAPDSGVAWDGYFFLVLPILTGAAVVLLVAWLGNNIVPGRHYPSYW